MAVITNYNIRQLTEYDIKNNPEVSYIIEIPERSSTKDADGKYPIRPVRKNIIYKTAIDGINILKLGYCCENKGIIYPIFLQMNGTYKQFQIGKNGIYEMQPENWKNVNDPNSEDKTSTITITGVRIPKDINFTLDYVVSIN